VIAARQLVIELRERVRRVHRIGIDAGADERSAVADAASRALMTATVGTETVTKAGLVQPPLLDVAEDERAIARDRSAEAPPTGSDASAAGRRSRRPTPAAADSAR
jgi:hypothetical protein